MERKDHPECAERAGRTGEQAPDHAFRLPAPLFPLEEQEQRHDDGDHEVRDTDTDERPQRRVHVLTAEVEYRPVHAPTQGSEPDRGQHPKKLQHHPSPGFDEKPASYPNHRPGR